MEAHAQEIERAYRVAHEVGLVGDEKRLWLEKNKIDASDMDLPDGKTCNDCAHYSRCKALFQCKTDAVKCDFAPSRFRLKSAKP